MIGLLGSWLAFLFCMPWATAIWLLAIPLSRMLRNWPGPLRVGLPVGAFLGIARATAPKASSAGRALIDSSHLFTTVALPAGLLLTVLLVILDLRWSASPEAQS